MKIIYDRVFYQQKEEERERKFFSKEKKRKEISSILTYVHLSDLIVKYIKEKFCRISFKNKHTHV